MKYDPSVLRVDDLVRGIELFKNSHDLQRFDIHLGEKNELRPYYECPYFILNYFTDCLNRAMAERFQAHDQGEL